jgi:hypothetical protein
MAVPRLEPTHWDDIHLAIQQSPQVGLKMNLVNDRSFRTELDQEVDIRAVMVLTAGDRAEHLDTHRMPASKECLNVVGTRYHRITDCSHV